jgi:hypothetical protein
MNRALIIKELRECAPVAAIAALAAAYTVWILTGGSAFPGVPGSTWSVPFVNDDIYLPLLLIAGGLAIALGFKQTVLEDVLGTYGYLLYRPVGRQRVFQLKLLVGLVLVQAIAGAMIFSYALWAATPGTHASPFFWSMTTTAWTVWAVQPLVYLGAAISGLRPARWYASRLMPLLGACVIAVVLVAQPWWWITAAGTLLASACLAVGLLHVAQSRDF